MTIAGHRTSVALEPEFWDALKEIAGARGLSLSALIAEIDAARLNAPEARNLSRAIRLYLFRSYRDAKVDLGLSQVSSRHSLPGPRRR